MRHNINIIFKRRARDRISIMGCIESRDAGLVAFSLRLRPPCRRAAVLCFGGARAKRRKGVLGVDDDTAEVVLPFPSLHPVQVVAFPLMDGTRSLFFRPSLLISAREREAISISRTYTFQTRVLRPAPLAFSHFSCAWRKGEGCFH